MKTKISVIGCGASALMLGCQLNTEKYEVTIYERNVAPARKFLVAGDGGLNITHSEPAGIFISRYIPDAFLSKAFNGFSNTDFINWLTNKGIKTYTGSSGRVFPVKELKPVEVLNNLLQHLKNNKVSIKTKHEWAGFTTAGDLKFNTLNGLLTIKNDITIFCLGGASWPVTGSKGDWATHFSDKGIKVSAFEASNCMFKINWPVSIIKSIEGKVLKNCAFTCGDKKHFGEAVITANGIEGSGVYPLSYNIRKQLKQNGKAKLQLDLKPNLSITQIAGKLSGLRAKDNYTESLTRKLNLTKQQLTLIKISSSKEEFLNVECIAEKIKNIVLEIEDTGEIENAISTVGGIELNEVTENFELKKMPGSFAIGEMLNYDAPTGGYLLQSCFSMGHYLSHYLNTL